jgi:nucleoid-associated protein YgaU
MQQIERYGVIALVFLLVTIVAVSFWGDSKSPGFWSRLTGRGDAHKMEIAKNAAAPEHPVDNALPLTNNPSPVPPAQPAPQAPIDAAHAPAPAVAATQPQAPAPSSAAPNAAPNPTLIANAPVAAAHAPGNGPIPLTNSQAPQPTPPAVAPMNQSAPQSAPVATPRTSQPTPSIAKDAHKAAKTTVESGPTIEYVVQKGDSLASIAQKNLGNSSRWTEIQSMNGGIQPKSLRVGTKLKLPVTTTAKSTTEKNAPKSESSAPTKKALAAPSETSPAGTVYVVKAGETLRSIAEKKLGSADRWNDIVAANPGLDPHKIGVGKTLKLPAREAHEAHDSSTLVAAALPSSSSTSGKPHVR